MLKFIFFFLFNLSLLIAKEQINGFDINFVSSLLSEISLKTGFEDSIFYDSLIKGNLTNYSRGYYNTRWKNFNPNYSSVSVLYFQKKQNWFLGFKSKNFNTEHSYHRFYLNNDMKNLYKYQKSQAYSSFSYHDIVYGKKWIYKGFSFLPYVTIRFHNFTFDQFSVPFPIDINRKVKRYIDKFPFLETNFIDEFFIYGPENSLAFDFLSQIPIEKFSRKSDGSNANLAYKIEKKVSNSINLFFEMSFYLFSIEQKDGKNDFLSYEKTDDNSYYYERSRLKWDIKSSDYEIGLEYNIYKSLNLLFQLSHNLFENIYSNYKGFRIQKTEDKINIIAREIFTNSLFYNQAYKNYSSNFSVGISLKF